MKGRLEEAQELYNSSSVMLCSELSQYNEGWYLSDSGRLSGKCQQTTYRYAAQGRSMYLYAFLLI